MMFRDSDLCSHVVHDMTRPRRYLDHAATSFPKPPGVAAAVARYLTEVGVAAGRGSHDRANAATRLLASCRERLARLLGVRDAARIVFTLNATDALNLALRGLLRGRDRVVTTVMEHNSVLRPLRSFEERGGVVIRVGADRDGLVDLAALEAALVPGTRLLAIQHASNVTGALQPVARAAELARRVGALVLVDAAQTIGCRLVRPSELGADLVAFAGHKGLLGPLGTGALWVAPNVELEPQREGGTGTSSEDDHQPSTWPERHEAGSLNLPGIAGLDAALAFLEQRGVDSLCQAKRELTARFLDAAAQIAGLEVRGPRDPAAREPVFALRVARFEPQELAMVFDAEFGIEVRAGLHCAPFAHRAIGTFPGGAVRASFGWDTSGDDVDALVDAIRHLAGGRA
jgi:cysteine desulfurase / selenocysteine lyase